MAAEASIDARVAVYLALIRLSFYFVMEFFGESSFVSYLNYFKFLKRILFSLSNN